MKHNLNIDNITWIYYVTVWCHSNSGAWAFILYNIIIFPKDKHHA